MQHAEQKPSQPHVSIYSNPNENVNSKKSILSTVPQQPYIKKTFSEMHSRSSHRSSINTQTLHSKIPKVIFQLIAQQTREQNQQRIRDSKQLNSKKSQTSRRRKSLFVNKQKTNQLFQEEDEIIQKPKPTRNMRRSIASMRFSPLDSIKSSIGKISCPICLIESPKKQFISICNNECQHLYCRSCMHQYVIFKIKMFQKVTCPDQGCNITLKITSELYAQLPIDTRERFKKIAQYNEVLQSEDKRICPNDKCDGILDISNSQQNPQCQKCKIIYCRKCFFQSHIGECDPFQLKFFQQTLNYRQCTSCKNMIEKNQGCNHMTCRCGYQFCYVCGVKWKSTHNCEGLDPNQPIVVDTWDCCCFQCNECDACDSLDFCCECMCFDEWSICELLPVRLVSKFLIIILVLTIGLPMWLLYILTQVVINLLMGILYGLFVIPCNQICDQSDNCKQILIGIVFLPITAVILMIIGIKQVLFEGGLSDLREELNLPCQVINQIIEL